MAKLTANQKQFNKDITWLSTNGGKEQDHAQSAMVAIAKHTIDCGDWTALNRLFACKIVNKMQAITYVRAVFKGLKYDKELGVFIKKTKKALVQVNRTLLDVHYTEYSNEGTPTLNLDNLLTVRIIEQTIARIASAKEKGTAITGDEHALVARIQALQVALA